MQDHLYTRETSFSATSLANRISAISFWSSNLNQTILSGFHYWCEREHTRYTSQWLRGEKYCFSHPEQGNLKRKVKIRNNTGTLLLCARSNLWGEALSANRLRLKCCKRQCWPFYISELNHNAVRIRLLSYVLVIALRCAYEPYFPTIKLIMHKNLRHSYRKQNTRALIKYSPIVYKPYSIITLL